MATMADEEFNNGLSPADLQEISRIQQDFTKLKLRVASLGHHRSYSTTITKLDEAGFWLNDRLNRSH